MSDEALGRRALLRRGGGLATAASLPAFVTSAGVAGGQVPSGPSGVHVAYGRDPGRTIRIGWSGSPAVEAHVEYARADGSGSTIVRATAAPVPGRELTTYRATLPDLEPNTAYEYTAVQDGASAGPFTVETAPWTGEPFTVTAVGDHGIADPNNPFQRPDTDDPDRVLEAAMALDPALHLGVGDISYANGHPSTWEKYFGDFEGHFATTPFMTVPGNHEAEPGTGLIQYDRRLNDLMPVPSTPEIRSKPRWHHVRYGNALFVGLNTTTDDCGQIGRSDEAIPIYDTRCRAGGVTYDQVQDAYIERTLADAAADSSIDWIVVYAHGPLWTTAPDHTPREDIRAEWASYFEKYGVDLVLSGDNHVYERTKPLRGETVAEDGTTFVTNGTGGVSHYQLGEPTRPKIWAYRSGAYFGVTSLDVNPGQLRLRYHAAPSESTASGDTIPDDGSFETVDEVTLVQDERGRTYQDESG